MYISLVGFVFVSLIPGINKKAENKCDASVFYRLPACQFARFSATAVHLPRGKRQLKSTKSIVYLSYGLLKTIPTDNKE